MKTAVEKLKEIVEGMADETNSIFPQAILMHINTWALEYEKLDHEKKYREGYYDGILKGKIENSLYETSNK